MASGANESVVKWYDVIAGATRTVEKLSSNKKGSQNILRGCLAIILRINFLIFRDKRGPTYGRWIQK